MSPAIQYCTFLVDEQWFGIPAVQVQEVLPAVPVTPVPLTTEVVGGLINLRGQIVLALDLRARLGLASRAADGTCVNLVLQTSDGLLCLQADGLRDVVSLELQPHKPDRMQPPPPTVRPLVRDVIQGVIPRADGLLLVLDVARVLDCELAVMAAPADHVSRPQSGTDDR